MLRLIHPTAPAPSHSDASIPLDGPRAFAAAGAWAFTLEGGERLVARSLPSAQQHWQRPSRGHLVAAAADGAHVAVGDQRGVTIFDAPEGRIIQEPSLSCAVCCLALDGSDRVVVGSHAGVVMVRRAERWQHLRPLDHRVTAVARTGEVVAAGDANGVVVRFELGADRRERLPGRDHAVTALALLPDASVLAAWADGVVQHWTPGHAEPLRSFHGAGGSISSLVHHDGLILAAGDERLIHRWDARSAEALGPLAGHARPILGMGVDSAGRLWTAGRDQRMCRWAPERSASHPALTGHGGGVRACCLREGSGFTGSRDGTVRRWTLNTGAWADTWLRGSSAITALIQVPAGGLVVGRSDGSLTRLDAPQVQRWNLRRGHRGPVTCLGWLDGLVISGGADGALRVWDGSSGAPVTARPDHSSRLRCLAIRADGAVVATGGYDGSLVIAAPLGGSPLARAEGHEGPMVSCTWLGERVITAGMDGALRCWSATGQLLGSTEAHRYGAVGVEALDHGRLVSIGGDGRVCLWRLGGREDEPYAPSLLAELDLDMALDGLGVELGPSGSARLLVGDRLGGAHGIVVEAP